MFSKFITFLDRWSHLGVHKEQPFHIQKITIFTNSLAIPCFISALSWSLSLIFNPTSSPVIGFTIAFGTAMSCVVVWYLNYKFKNRAARITLIISQQASLLISCILYSDAFGLHPYWFNMIIYAHLLLDSKDIKLKASLVTIAFIFSILSLTGFLEFPSLQIFLDPETLKFGARFNAVNASIYLLMCTAGFSSLSHHFELKLKESESQILQGNKLASLGEMSGGIAHEINNPLSIIIGRTELLKSKLDQNKLTDEFLNTNLTSILTTSRRIAKVVYGLKKFARVSENEPKSEHNLVDIVNDTLLLTQEKLKSLGIDLTTENIEGVSVYCNPLQISQVLYNLICNSAEHAEKLEEKWIKIKAKQTRKTVEIFVVDSGHGIPKKIAARIMEPFFTTKGVGKGTGMGLSISHGIIQSEGGELVYDSSEPHTTFVIRLPRREIDYRRVA
jgi:signal transduction histidine kinase